MKIYRIWHKIAKYYVGSNTSTVWINRKPTQVLGIGKDYDRNIYEIRCWLLDEDQFSII